MKPTPRPDWGSTELLVWVDIETTGLDPAKDDIIEVALAITEKAPHFELIQSVSIPIHPIQRKFRCDYRDQWPDVVPDFHLGNTGLLQLANDEGMPIGQATNWLRGWVAAVASYDFAVGPMCGASVGFDRSFLSHRMISMHDTLWSYRNFDVSTLRELMSQLHGPELVTSLLGENMAMHRAESDVRESIDHARRLTQLSRAGTDMATVADVMTKNGRHDIAELIRDDLREKT